MKKIILITMIYLFVVCTGCAKFTEEEMDEVKEDYEIQIEELTEKYEEEIADLEEEADSLEESIDELQATMDAQGDLEDVLSEYEMQISELTAEKDFQLALLLHVLPNDISSEYALFAAYAYEEGSYRTTDTEELFELAEELCPEEIDIDLYLIGTKAWSNCLSLQIGLISAEEVYTRLDMILPVWNSVGTDVFNESEQEVIELLNLVYEEVGIIYSENIAFSESDEHYINLDTYFIELGELLELQ